MIKIKPRIGIWAIIIVLGVPITLAALAGEWESALSLAAILGVLSTKLIESEEKKS